MQYQSLRTITLLFTMLALASCSGGGGGGGGGGEDNEQPPLSAPMLAAQPGVRGATLNWTNAAEQSYNLYITSAVDCDLDNYATCTDGQLAVGVTPPHQVNGLVNGRAYYFTLEASDSDGNSGRSNQTAARPNELAFDAEIYAMARHGDAIYIGGGFSHVGVAAGGAIPLDADSGAPAPGDFPQVNGYVSAIVPDGSGGWYLGGYFTAVGDVSRDYVAHLLADGSVNPDWNPAIDGNLTGVTSLALAGDTLYIGGAFETVNGEPRENLAAVNTAGELQAWNPQAGDGPNDRVIAIAIADDQIFVAGFFDTVNGEARNSVAAIDANGALLDWDADANGTTWALVVHDDAVYLGGSFSSIQGVTRNRLAALDLDGVLLDWNPDANSSVDDFAIGGDTLYVVGNFTDIGGTARNRAAAIGFDGTLGDWNPDIGEYVSAVNVAGDRIYLAGDLGTVGGTERQLLAAVDTQGTLLDWNPVLLGDWVDTIAVAGDRVYVSGGINGLNPVPRNRLAAIATDGSLLDWQLEVTGSRVDALAISGDTLYLGGLFDGVDGVARDNIAAWDLAAAGDGELLDWNPGANHWVWDLLLDGDTLYAGGRFTEFGGEIREHLAAISTSGVLQSWSPSANNEVFALAQLDDTIYVGGLFTTIDGTDRRLAAIDTSGNLLPWDPNPSGGARALAIRDGKVIAAGGFIQINGNVPRRMIAEIEPDGPGEVTEWNPLEDLNEYGSVSSLVADGEKLYVGGHFNDNANQVDSLLAFTGNSAAPDVWEPMTVKPADGDVNAIVSIGDTLYVGGNFSGLRGGTFGNFAIINAATGAPADPAL